MAKSTKKVEEFETPADVAAIPNLENIVAVLKANPHVHVIHVNEAGEWRFMEYPGFTAYERADILNG